MWNSTNNVVEDYLAQESTIRSQSLVTAEWNLNIIDNVDELGNYRYRPVALRGDDDFAYADVPSAFVKETAKNPGSKYYYGATDADTAVDGGLDENDDPVIFSKVNKKMKSLFSLEECIGRFRPRSGINKVIYFDGKYLNRVHPDMAQQPRFYFPTPNDRFKYWTSFRTEGRSVALSSPITKVYATDTVNGIIKIKSPLNSFSAGDNVTITGTGINDGATPTPHMLLDGKTFVVESASSNYVRIYSDIVVATSTVNSGAKLTSNSVHNSTRGLSFRDGDEFIIEDASPFVVYKDLVPANRLVVKMQTKVGDVDLGPYIDLDGNSFEDPFFDKDGNNVKAVPSDWKIEILNKDNVWVPAYHFDPTADQPFDIPTHGQVELAYGLIVPDSTDNIESGLRDVFLIAGKISSPSALPVAAPVGYAYLEESSSGPGTFHVAHETGFDSFDAEYGWYLNTQEVPTNTSSFVTDFTNPDSFVNNSVTAYRDFQFIKGMRIVVRTMTIENATFDLIEMSPRLAANITDMTTKVSVAKHASDLGSSGMPVGQLLSSTGSLSLFDYDESFNKNNVNSIISDIQAKNLQIKIYETLMPGNGTIYSVPIKTLYADGFPQTSHQDRSVEVKLRDLFFYFESMKAPEILIPNCSLSMAVSCLMDSIGFSNYTFKRPAGEKKEAVFPYFYVGPDTTVAQALQDLAVSTQTAMFLDEYNNLVLMSKEYMMPKNELARPTDFVFSGNSNELANISQIQSIDDDVYNDGKISYETKYIQKSYSSLSQANYLDSDKTWIYKPVLLWEVSPESTTKSWNDESSKQSSYTLAAIPLDTNLTSALPTVEGGVIKNNIIDLGEAVYWLSRYNGYFYSNGEIIKFDAVQYNITGTGNVWISDVEEYQKYFSGIPFGGKIYPTGRVRIFAEPFYDSVTNTLKEGPVAKHGRAQFGTSVTSHRAGLDPAWQDKSYHKTIFMQHGYMFNGGAIPVTYQNVAAGVLNSTSAAKSVLGGATVNGVIKNYLSAKEVKEKDANSKNTTTPGTIQSSALVLDGPSYPSGYNPQSFVQYVYKEIDSDFKHFSTRMRIIGSMEDGRSQTQTPVGSTPYYTVDGKNIGGSSGGIAIGVNPHTNNGYYYEIVALTDTEVNAYNANAQAINTMFFYKIQADAAGNAIPIVLWSGLSPIICDDGRFTGQGRMTTEKNPTVYDLGVEYSVNKNGSLRFDLYLNDKPVGTATDNDPLSMSYTETELTPKKKTVKKNAFALFIRGSSRLMFENVFAIEANQAIGKSDKRTNMPVSSAFGFGNQSTTNAANKFALSGAIKKTVLDGISSTNEPEYNMYFEEFGTIMRECAYFNVRYDKAYPALSAKISPTFNNNQGYAISGFTANAFGAEFLIFNTTDTVLSLDSGSGNYLRIQGVTFTQNSKHDLTVDEFFKDKGDLSDPEYRDGKVYNERYDDSYDDIKKNRLANGKKSFTINAPYIQSQDAANDLMQWLVGKIMKPRKAVGMAVFSLPHIQLGDIVEIDYAKNGIDQVGASNGRYVVYSIQYDRDKGGPSMQVHLSEVK